MKNPKYIFAFTLLACLLGVKTAFATGDLYPLNPMVYSSANGLYYYNGQAAFQVGTAAPRIWLLASTSTGAVLPNYGGAVFTGYDFATYITTTRKNTYGTTTKPFLFFAQTNNELSSYWSTTQALSATSSAQVYYGFVNWNDGTITGLCPYEGMILGASRKIDINAFPLDMSQCPAKPDSVTYIQSATQGINISVIPSTPTSATTTIATSTYKYIFGHIGDTPEAQMYDTLKIVLVLILWSIAGYATWKLGKTIKRKLW